LCRDGLLTAKPEIEQMSLLSGAEPESRWT
jgi:hypothetical protein